VARITCSIGIPQDHRLRIYGNKGMISADTYRHDRCAVYFERYSQLSLNARKAMSVRTNTLLHRLFGVGGRKLPLLRLASPCGDDMTAPKANWRSPWGLLRALKRRELGQQDKVLGVAELADAILNKREQFPAHDFTLHMTELTIAIQGSGTRSETATLQTTFKPLRAPVEAWSSGASFARSLKPTRLERLTEPVLLGMHRH
jgi:hypothetical protein